MLKSVAAAKIASSTHYKQGHRRAVLLLCCFVLASSASLTASTATMRDSATATTSASAAYLAPPANPGSNWKNGSLTITWSEVPRADGYYIDKSVNGGDWVRVATVTPGTTTSWTDNNPGENPTYQVQSFMGGWTSGDPKEPGEGDVVVSPPVTVNVADSFSGSGGLGTTETGGREWLALNSTAGQWGRSGGYADTTAAAAANPMAVVDTGNPSVAVTVTPRTGVSHDGQAAYSRVSDANNWWRLRLAQTKTTTEEPYEYYSYGTQYQMARTTSNQVFDYYNITASTPSTYRYTYNYVSGYTHTITGDQRVWESADHTTCAGFGYATSRSTIATVTNTSSASLAGNYSGATYNLTFAKSAKITGPCYGTLVSQNSTSWTTQATYTGVSDSVQTNTGSSSQTAASFSCPYLSCTITGTTVASSSVTNSTSTTCPTNYGSTTYNCTPVYRTVYNTSYYWSNSPTPPAGDTYTGVTQQVVTGGPYVGYNSKTTYSFNLILEKSVGGTIAIVRDYPLPAGVTTAPATFGLRTSGTTLTPYYGSGSNPTDLTSVTDSFNNKATMHGCGVTTGTATNTGGRIDAITITNP